MLFKICTINAKVLSHPKVIKNTEFYTYTTIVRKDRPDIVKTYLENKSLDQVEVLPSDVHEDYVKVNYTFKEEVCHVEIKTLEELLQLSKDVGESVIINPEENTIIFYEGLIE